MISKIVLAQVKSEPLPKDNLIKAEIKINEAKCIYNAEMVVFPEGFMTDYPIGTYRKIILGEAQYIDGEFVTTMKGLAKKYDVWLIFGMAEKVEDKNDDRNYNTTVVINSDGEIVSTYRKTHMYDAFGTKESENLKPGNKLFEPIDTPFGKIGLFVCYELRFPEIARYQAIRGADIIIVPAAWFKGELKDLHWSTLIRSRAIENTVYVLGCDHYSKEKYMGDSLAVDPMGVTISSGGEEESLIPCFIDLDRITRVRKKLPSYVNRRPELYMEE